MKTAVVFLLNLFPVFLFAQQTSDKINTITKDSLPYSLNHNWKFHGGDDSLWSQRGFDDSNWIKVNPMLWLENRKDGLDTFNSICWFRLHFIADSSIVDRPLALSISQGGASVIYLDGKKITSFGQIKGREDSKYDDPQKVPFIITITNEGEHLLAIKYANFYAQRNRKIYQSYDAGFQIKMEDANTAILNKFYTTLYNTTAFILMFAIFITLSFLHLFLYLYYRVAKSNLIFSIFCLSLSLIFLTPYMLQTSNNPQTILNWAYIGTTAGIASCFSLSSLINNLFGKKKLRHRIIAALCLGTLITYFADSGTGALGLFGIIFIVSSEALILTIAAIIKKIPGARIIGVGILFFALFLLITVIALVTQQNLSFSDDTVSGQIAEYLIALSIFSVPGSMSVYLAWSYSRISKNLKLQLEQVELLSAKTFEQEQEKKRMLESENERLENEVVQRTAEIEKKHEELKAEKKKSDDLLHNILPEEVADELKQRGTSSAKFFDHVTVLFTDFVNFTKAGERMSPQELVDELNTCFKAFDEIISKYNIEKIKTIGDAYLAVSGLPVADEEHALKATDAALQIQHYMLNRRKEFGDKTFEVRIGIHSGSVVAGIVGVKKFAYDIWGDTVNTAARMEQNSEPGKINISQTTYELIKDHFNCTYRGEISAKNKGDLSMYFVYEKK
jgi:class 3 adenylate cyclase